MAYTRWGMTNADAAALTGTDEASLTDAVMDAAEADLWDALGWEPDSDDYTGTTPLSAPVRAFGRAVAWQAAYRVANPPQADDGAAAVEAESMTDYSVTYAAPVTEAYTAPRAYRLLRKWGWITNAGVTGHTRPGGAGDFQTA